MDTVDWMVPPMWLGLEAEANRLFKEGRFRLSRQRCRSDLGMAWNILKPLNTCDRNIYIYMYIYILIYIYIYYMYTYWGGWTSITSIYFGVHQGTRVLTILPKRHWGNCRNPVAGSHVRSKAQLFCQVRGNLRFVSPFGYSKSQRSFPGQVRTVARVGLLSLWHDF